MKVAFICSKFPCYDEAFILREIVAMSKRSDILIFSLRNAKDRVVHDDAKDLLDKTVYTPYFFSVRLFYAHFLFLIMHPVRYVRAFLRLVFGNMKSREFFFKNLVFFPKAVLMARRMKKEGITHMHAYWATYPASVALLISELTGIRYSFTGHAHDIYLDTTYLSAKMKRAEFVSTCTSQNKDYLLGVEPKYPWEKVWVTYHGLNLNQFEVNGKQRNKVFEILSVGTLHPHKGFKYLLNALYDLKKKGVSFHATIIGGGPLASELKNYVRRLELTEQVVMTGPLKQSEVIPYYKKADVVVLMAQGEWHWGIPNVLIEALAAKAAVITTRFGSVEELIQDGKTGLLVPAKDSKPLAVAIERLANDEVLRKKLIDAGHKFVIENFDLDKNIQIFERGFRRENAVALVA